MKTGKQLKLTVLAAGTLSLSSCMMVAATPSGIREFARGQNGLVVTGKSAPNKLDEYHKTQRFAEEQGTLRIRLGNQSEEN